MGILAQARAIGLIGGGIRKIISGGQTGADRAALDIGIACNVPHGGWCPKGRRAEDGTIDTRYELTETPSPDSSQRTEWNVRDSDGTAIISMGRELRGGSALTAQYAGSHGKPWLHISRQVDGDRGAQRLDDFVRTCNIRFLNVAGPRQSEEPEVGTYVKAVMEEYLMRVGRCAGSS